MPIYFWRSQLLSIANEFFCPERLYQSVLVSYFDVIVNFVLLTWCLPNDRLSNINQTLIVQNYRHHIAEG